MNRKPLISYKIIDGETGDKVNKGCLSFDDFEKLWEKTKRKMK